jgi:hypothetical protein
VNQSLTPATVRDMTDYWGREKVKKNVPLGGAILPVFTPPLTPFFLL